MINFVFQMVVSNAAICLGLALIALIVGRTFKRPSITHMLWLLVLVKMLIPPVVSISTFPVPWMMATDSPAAFETDVQTVQKDIGNAFVPASPERDDFGTAIQWKQLLFLAWLLGSGIVFAWSLSQVYRFHRLLKKESDSGDPEIYDMAAETASYMGLRKIPEIRLASARMSPMVWWIGCRVKIVVPDVLLERMESQELRWILAHEMAHVRRRDFCARWVEWLTCVIFWWHPIAWWARHNLRINEELCCDELVLSCLKPQPVTYGESLLKTVEILSDSINSKPILASGITSGELLKRRIRILLSNKWKAPRLRWVQAFILLGALIILPLNLTSAQTRNKDMEQIPQAEDSSNFPSAIRVDSIMYPDYFLLPGMRVDVIRTGTLPDGSERIVSRVMLRNIQVLSIGENVEQNSEGRPQKVSMVTLLVTPEQARELALAGSGRIQLVLQPPMDEEGGTEPDGMREVSILGAKLSYPQKRTGLPSLIPDGMRAVAIRVDSITGADYVLPGMRVDIIRKDPAPNGSKLDDSRIILDNIQVLTAGENMEQDSEGRPQKVSLVTLQVTPEQAQKLAKAASNRIQLEVHN